MRIRIASVFIACMFATACQRAGDPAEESAHKVAERAEAPALTVQPAASQPITAPAPIAEPEPAEAGHACGGACGASCNGHCGASCMGGMSASAEAPKPVPADAQWQALQVEGMHCGGCARRIQTALAQLDGVVGSEVDLGTHTVRVAVKQGIDARALASPAITDLGYRVVR